MQTKEHLLTSIDYIKILVEEDRFGESFERLNELKDNMTSMCKAANAKFDVNELELSKTIVKSKPNQWVFLNKTWVKVINITKSEICLEINKGNIIKKIYRIKKDAVPATQSIITS